MKNDAYWKERMQIMEQTRYDGDVQTYHEIERIYDRAIAETEKEIRAWYNRFAENNGITLADANKLLTDKELAELKWDVNEYINRGRENAIDSRWKKELENASARYHISRLESIKLQIQQRAESVMGSEQDLLDKHVREIYSDTYYHTAYEIQRGTGVGWQLERLDDRRIDAVIKKPWAVDGSNFSERIWNQRDKLVNTLHQELTQSIIRGEDPERAIAALTKMMGNSKSNARRLIMTESAAFASRSQQDCYNDLDVEKYKIVATLDNVTCDICGGLDGKVFKMSEYAVGSTAPPFHPNCRTVTVPYFEDDKNAVRAARGADGKTYTIPADTKYKEWKKAMVDGGENPFKVEPEPKQPEPKPNVMTYAEKIDTIRVEFNVAKQEYDDLNAKIKRLEKENDQDYVLKNNVFTPDDLVEKRIISEWNRVGKMPIDSEIKRFEDMIRDFGDEFGFRTKQLDELKKLKRIRDRYSKDDIQKMEEHQIELRNKEHEIQTRIEQRRQEIAIIENERPKAAAKLEPIIQKAGKITINQVKPKIEERNEKYDKIAERCDDLEDQIREIEQKYGFSVIRNRTLPPDLQKIADEYKSIKQQRIDMNLREYYDLANITKETIAQTRKMGSASVDMTKHITTRKSLVMQAVLDAYDVYPSDFSQASEKRSKIALKKVSRGYHLDGQPTMIAISGSGQGAFETAIHELGHRMEKAIPIIRDLEQMFYERRTKGEKLERLKDLYPIYGYNASEKTRKDQFLDAYMGKDYGGDAYELVSMGFQYAYCDPEELMKDSDMAEWIFGILTLV